MTFHGLGFQGAEPLQVSRRVGRQDLARLFAEMRFTRGVEVGTWTGTYAQELCTANAALWLTCVDPWKEYKFYNEAKNNQARLDAAYQEAQTRLQPYGCTLLRMSSEQGAARVPDASLDFVYIDANHAEAFVRQDLTLWTPKVRPGGIIAGHDYIVGTVTKSHKHLEVRAAVDAFTAARKIAPVYVLAKDKSPSFFWVQA